MLRNFHLPNPGHDGTPLEGTFSPCNDEAHVRNNPEEHQQIDVVGRSCTVRFDCEHNSHVYVIHQLQSTDNLLNDLANLIPCQHGADSCANCGHDEKGACGNRMKVTLMSGALPPVIKQAFGSDTTN